MMKKIAWTLAVLPFVGIGWLMLGNRSGPASKSSIQPMPKNQPSAIPSGVRTPEKKPLYTPEELANAIEVRKRTDASSAELAKLLTPEVRKRLVDAGMRRFAQSHASLFESWNLDEKTMDELLRIVRERQQRLSDIQQVRDETGSKGAREYLQNREIEYKLAEIQLTNLLGDDRYQQLSKAEARESDRNAAYVRAKYGHPAD